MAAKQTKTIKQVRKDKLVRVKVASNKLAVPLYNERGEAQGVISLPEQVFGQKPNRILLAQAVRVYLTNQRSARAKTKGRGEINRTTRKIYRQKGTGGARHGARSAPIFVGGGIAHGPRGIENYKRELTRKMKQKALVSAFSAKFEDGRIAVADIEKIEPKTKNVSRLLYKMALKNKVLLVHAGGENVFRAARNIEGVTTLPATQVTAYDVLKGQNILLTRDSINVLEARVVTK